MYIAVRRDLSGPQQAVQAIHAAIEASKAYHNGSYEHPYVVLLGVRNEQKLNDFKDHLDKLGLIHYDEFREPDRNNELTSVATVPIGEEMKQHFRKFQLLK